MRIASRALAVAWAVAVAGLTVLLAAHLREGFVLETNILKLLPAPERDPVVDSALASFTERMSGRMVVLIGHPEGEVAAGAARKLAVSLDSTGLFEPVESVVSADDGRAWYELYFPFRYQLLTPELRRLLAGPDPAGRMAARTARALYGPTPTLYGKGLARDPLMLFSAFLKHLSASSGRFTMEEGVVTTVRGDTTFAVLALTVRGDPMARPVQERVLGAVESRLARVRASLPGAWVDYTGFARFAYDAYTRARAETTTIGLVSLAGVVLLLIATFGSPRELAVGALPIAVGLCAALAVSLTVFERLHVITLTMGAALIGVCIDYAFHYFADRMVHREGWSGAAALRRILPGIGLGALTSVMGYTGFFLSPFPGLTQIALFSSTGLIAAFATVVCWYPFLLRSVRTDGRDPLPSRLAAVLPAAWARVPRGHLAAGTVVLALAAAAGLFTVRFDDDIRALGYTDREIERSDAAVRERVSGYDGSRFVLVRGGTEEELLRRVEAVSGRLAAARSRGALSGYLAPSVALQSRSRQAADRALLAASLGSELDTLTRALSNLGFTAPAIEELTDSLRSPPTRFLTPEAWLASAASRPWRHLWLGRTGGERVAMVLLEDIREPGAVREACASVPGAEYIDRVGELSALLGRYRAQASALVGGAYAVILLLLVVRYGGRGGVLVMIPPVLSAALTVGGLALSGVSLTLMHVLALLLVLGIGIDYTIFFAESGGRSKATMLAVALSACTTFLSFGLLFVSRTPAVRSIGLVVAPTSILCMVLAPVAARVKGPCRR